MARTNHGSKAWDDVFATYSTGGAGVRTCVHCFRINNEPHDEWCPFCGKDDLKLDDSKPSGGGGGGSGPGDPNVPVLPIEPDPGGAVVEAEFKVVKENRLPAPQRVIEHQPGIPAAIEHESEKRLPRPRRE